MPFSREGKCVKKEKSDGSSETVKCHSTVEKAKKHLTALNITVRESAMFPELSMAIVKLSREKSDGTMRLRLVNSDTGEDSFGEKMSLELFHDFVERSDGEMKVPAPFDRAINEGEFWEGGAPYLSIAHFKSGGGKNVPGEQEKLYIDGEKLKSVDILHDTLLGKAVWKSIYDDQYAEEKSFDNPVRVSIGFLDLQHKHTGVGEDEEDVVFTRKSLKGICKLCASGAENKVYLKGHLVHKAFTRVPAHPRTMVEVEKMAVKGDIKTKKDDAESIVEDLADDLQEKSSVDDEIMVVKTQERHIIILEDGFLFKVSYKIKDNKIEAAERSKWEQLNFIPVKSEATENEWKLEFEKDEVEKSTTEEVVMTEKTIVKEEKVSEPEVKETVEAKEPIVEPVVEPVVEEDKSASRAAFEAFEAKRLELAEKGVYGDEALAELQSIFNDIGKGAKEDVQPKGAAVVSVESLKTALREVLPEFLPQFAQQPSASAQPTKAEVDSGVPKPRSITAERTKLPAEGQAQKSQIQKIAEKGIVA